MRTADPIGLRVLVTGGAGFIGSHLCERLLARGAEVVCVDNFDPFYDPALKRRNLRRASTHANFQLIEGSFGDPSIVERAFEAQPTVLVHLAALAGVRPSIERPADYMRVNVQETAQFFRDAVDGPIDRIVFASSSSVYGNRRRVPFAEDDRVDDPVSPYAASKKAGELLAYTLHHLYGVPVTSLRFFTVYGPRQRPEMAIHKFVRAIFDETPVRLFGDGSSSRDYTYIDDIIDGIVAAIERPQGYAIFNLGGSDPVSLSGLVDALEAACGRRAIRQHTADQPGDVRRTFASLDRASEHLGYAPQVRLQEGLRRFVAWYKARFGIS